MKKKVFYSPFLNYPSHHMSYYPKITTHMLYYYLLFTRTRMYCTHYYMHMIEDKEGKTHFFFEEAIYTHYYYNYGTLQLQLLRYYYSTAYTLYYYVRTYTHTTERLSFFTRIIPAAATTTYNNKKKQRVIYSF